MIGAALLCLALRLGPPTESGERPAWLDEIEDWESPTSDEAPAPGPSTDSAPAPVEKTDNAAPESPIKSPPEPEPPPPRADTVTGALRLVGAFLHYADDLAPLGVEDDGLVALVGRVIVTDTFADAIDFELNVFADISRAPSALGGTFATTGSFTTPYRAPALTFNIWDQGSVRGVTGIDRARIRFGGDKVFAELGRFPVSYTVTGVFTPNDFFAPFSATAINRAFKPGVDAARLSAALGRRGSMEAVAVMGWSDTAQPSWGRSAVILRPSVVLRNFEWSAIGGKVAERWVVGAGAQGDAGPIGLRAEAHLGIPDRDGNGRDEESPHVRAAGGPNINFAWQNTTLGAEYAYFSDGGAAPRDYLGTLSSRFPDDLPYLGRHYVGLNAGLDTIPILRLQAITLVNAIDGSGNAGLFLNYNVSDEADISAGGFVPWGRSPSVGPGGIELGSEFGASPVTAFVESRVFF